MNIRAHVSLFFIALALIFHAGCARAAPPQAMCAMGPLKCPDGTYVFPGPGCTFGPCPGKPLPAPAPQPAPDQDAGGAQKSGDGDRQMIEDGQSTDPDDKGSIIIDRDRAADEDAPAPPVFVQHGTAGTATIGPGQTISPDRPPPGFPDYPLETVPDGPMTVSFVFEHRTSLNEKHVTVRGTIVGTLLADKACPPGRGMCAQPRITLGDSGGGGKYTIEVLLPESDKTAYEENQTVEISGIVSSGPQAVVVRKE